MNIIQEYENKITKVYAKFSGKILDLFVYKNNDYISNLIKEFHSWEEEHTTKILKALEYYSKKKQIENKDIYLLDIGSNIGWYTYSLGKYGYNILSFEASKINNYIMYKNYCLNKDVKVTIIDKGLDIDDKICSLKTDSNNQGNGIILCENRDKKLYEYNGDLFKNIELTKLSRYIRYLSNKNLAVIKIDIEGAEANVIRGGKKLISKYHVPFITIEYEIRLLESHGTKVLEFLQFLENNGYKFSLNDFLSKQYISIFNLRKNFNLFNLFIIHENFIE